MTWSYEAFLAGDTFDGPQFSFYPDNRFDVIGNYVFFRCPRNNHCPFFEKSDKSLLCKYLDGDNCMSLKAQFESFRFVRKLTKTVEESIGYEGRWSEAHVIGKVHPNY